MARGWQEDGKRMARGWQDDGQGMARRWQGDGKGMASARYPDPCCLAVSSHGMAGACSMDSDTLAVPPHRGKGQHGCCAPPGCD